MKLSARLHGMDGLALALGRVADEDELRGELAASAEELRQAARTELDETAGHGGSTGALSRSLVAGSADDGMNITVSTQLDYGWHLEFGTLDRAPRPWLAPALDKTRPGVLARLRNWLARAGKRAST